MRPLAEFAIEARRRIRGVLTDIDDTLTTDGRLTAEAYGAMERLQRAGFLVIPITGRPAGWCDHIARMWPVDAVVGENGAFFFRYDDTTRKMTKRFLVPDAERAANRLRLESLRDEILAAVPGTALASDQLYREADLAIDFCEDVERLPTSEIERIIALFEDAGATAKASSIHVNGWFGTYDKLTMTRIMLDECFGIDMEAEKDAFVFAGDSPNDSPMFAYFPNAVGVANVRDFDGRLPAEPAFVTEARGGAGFSQIATTLIAAGH
jgi:HAD superfamily hydrolase (TIGR01484 family)